MVEFCIWRPKDAIAQFIYPHTKIDVIKCDRKIYLIQPTNLVIQVSPHHKTGRSDSGKILNYLGAADVAAVVFREKFVGMARNASDPQNNSRVLNIVVREKKFSAHSANLRSQRVTDHFPQPTWGNYLKIIVEQSNDLSFRRPNSQIIHR